jgi:hypothetical protein
MMVHKTKYLVLQQSSAFPEFLLEYMKGGGDKDKVVILNWPYVSCIFNIAGKQSTPLCCSLDCGRKKPFGARC